MTKANDRKDFVGALAEPIAASDADNYLTQALGKFPELFAHYGIPERNDDGSRNDLLLALALAREHVPGFQPPRKETRGRKRKGLAEKVELLAEAGRQMEALPYMNAVASAIAEKAGKNAATVENELSTVRRDPEVRDFVKTLLARSQKK